MTYVAKAVNTALEHENRIHAPEVAAKFGFGGPLVPGVNVYGVLTAPVVERLGEEWLQRGYGRLQLFKPYYPEEEIRVELSESGEGWMADAGRARLLAGRNEAARPVALGGWAMPVERPVIGREVVQAGAALGSFPVEIAESQGRLVAALGERLSCYGRLAHPTVLLGLANDILVRNFVMPAWIHTGSEVRLWRAVGAAERVEVRGVIRERFEKKGHEMLRAEIQVVGADGEVAMGVEHTAIYRIAGA